MVRDPDHIGAGGERLADVLDVQEPLDDDRKPGRLAQKADVAEAQVALEVEEVAPAAALRGVIAGPDPGRKRAAEPDELIARAGSQRVGGEHDRGEAGR